MADVMNSRRIQPQMVVAIRRHAVNEDGTLIQFGVVTDTGEAADFLMPFGCAATFAAGLWLSERHAAETRRALASAVGPDGPLPALVTAVSSEVDVARGVITVTLVTAAGIARFDLPWSALEALAEQVASGRTELQAPRAHSTATH